MIALGFVVAAALATAVRAVVTGVDTPFSRQMDATIAVNAIGSFLLGMLIQADADTLLIAGVAGLGSLTTFSTMISQCECIGRERAPTWAAFYLGGTVALSLLSAWLGITVSS